MRSGLGTPYASAHPHVVGELAGHLENFYEDLIRRGEAEHEAERKALAQVSDWIRLRKKLERASEGDSMRNEHIRAVWLPGLLSTVVGFGLLRAILAMGARPWWVMQVEMSQFLHMDFLLGEHVADVLLFPIPWSLVLPLAGAAGAFASWRAGGRPGQRVIAALFPSLVIGGLAMLSLILRAAFERGGPSDAFARNLLLFSLPWVILPGLALLVGSLPFARLGMHSPQST